MEKQATKSSRNGKNLLALGFGGIAILFFVYVRLQNSELTPPISPNGMTNSSAWAKEGRARYAATANVANFIFAVFFI